MVIHRTIASRCTKNVAQGATRADGQTAMLTLKHVRREECSTIAKVVSVLAGGVLRFAAACAMRCVLLASDGPLFDDKMVTSVLSPDECALLLSRVGQTWSWQLIIDWFQGQSKLQAL